MREISGRRGERYLRVRKVYWTDPACGKPIKSDGRYSHRFQRKREEEPLPGCGTRSEALAGSPPPLGGKCVRNWEHRKPEGLERWLAVEYQ